MINALDNNRIQFNNMENKALFYGLLTVTVDYAMDGNTRLRNQQTLRRCTKYPLTPTLSRRERELVVEVISCAFLS